MKEGQRAMIVPSPHAPRGTQMGRLWEEVTVGEQVWVDDATRLIASDGQLYRPLSCCPLRRINDGSAVSECGLLPLDDPDAETRDAERERPVGVED